ASQIFTVLSKLALAMRLPSGLNTTQVTPSAWPRRERSSVPLEASQTFTVLSELALAIRLPSGLNTTLVTNTPCPLSVRSSVPLSASHTCTSCLLPQARRLPLGLNATPLGLNATRLGAGCSESISVPRSASHTFNFQGW